MADDRLLAAVRREPDPIARAWLVALLTRGECATAIATAILYKGKSFTPEALKLEKERERAEFESRENARIASRLRQDQRQRQATNLEIMNLKAKALERLRDSDRATDA